MTATRLFDRAVVRLWGEDVRGFLNGLVTNDVTGQSQVWAALLTPQGKVLFDFIVWPEVVVGSPEIESLLLDCEASQADALIKRLSAYRLRRKIDIWLDIPNAVHWHPDDIGIASPDPRLPELGERWLGPAFPEDTPADAAWLAHRLHHGVTEGHAELGDLLWLECNAAELNGVSFSKGCYIGQENTARMNWRAKVNRRLMVVPLAQSDPARQRAAYPELGLAVDHLRVEAIDPATLPDWLRRALKQQDGKP